MKKAKAILALVACGLLMSGGFSQVYAANTDLGFHLIFWQRNGLWLEWPGQHDH